MSNKKPKNINKEEAILLAKIFFDTEKIYEEYADMVIKRNDFRDEVKSHTEFIQELCRDGFKKDDAEMLNAINNFCTSFLIKNGLSETKEEN